MRLLYVIDALTPGGAETSLLEMTRGLVAAGIELHVLPLGTRLDLAPALEMAGARVHERRATSGRVGNVRAVMETARRIKPTRIHTTLFEADLAGRTAARVLRIPASTSIVSDSYNAAHYAEVNSLKLHAARKLDSWTASSADSFHAISHAVAQTVPPRLGIDRGLVKVIPRGRDPQTYPFRPAAVREQTRRELGIAQQTPVILAVARLDPEKGLDHLIRALPGLLTRYPETVTLIAGKDGRAAPALRQSARTVRGQVRFLGHRTDVPALLAAADVLCFPSEREGFGGVLIEALAVGCPVVASSIPTSQEVLGAKSSPTGLLVPVGSSSELGRALEATLADRLEAADRARDGRSRFDELYTLDRVLPQMVAFFRND